MFILTTTLNCVEYKFNDLATSVARSNHDKVFNIVWDLKIFLNRVLDYVNARSEGNEEIAELEIIVRNMYRLEVAIDALSNREFRALEDRFIAATGKTANQVIDMFVEHI